MTKRGRPSGTINRKTGFELLRHKKPIYAVTMSFDWSSGWPFAVSYSILKILTKKEAQAANNYPWYKNYWLAHAFVLRRNEREKCKRK